MQGGGGHRAVFNVGLSQCGGIVAAVIDVVQVVPGLYLSDIYRMRGLTQFVSVVDLYLFVIDITLYLHVYIDSMI